MLITNPTQVKNLEKETKAITTREGSTSQKIRDLFHLGYAIKEISILVGVRYNFAYNVISNYVNIQDIETHKTTKESKGDKIVEMYLEGQKPKDIAKALRSNVNYVYQTINKYRDSILVQVDVDHMVEVDVSEC